MIWCWFLRKLVCPKLCEDFLISYDNLESERQDPHKLLQETRSGSDEYMIQEKENEAENMKEPRRQGTLPNGIHSSKSITDVKTP